VLPSWRCCIGAPSFVVNPADRHLFPIKLRVGPCSASLVCMEMLSSVIRFHPD
jgi:hypothetical protein